MTQAPDQAFGTNMSFAVVADNFSLGGGPGASYDISSLRFWSLQSADTDYTGSVYWAIHADAGGSIGAVLQSAVATTGALATGLSSGFGYAEYVFDIGVAFNLAAGDYWLALHNGPLASNSATEMYWGTAAAGAGPAGVFDDLTDDSDQGWLGTDNEHAFLISGERFVEPPPPLPEPATLALVLGGLMAAGAVRRQRQTC